MQSHGATWQARPLFVTSTFADMQAERDHLRDHVFPVLEERLRQRRLHLEPIDLRCGVDTFSVEDTPERDLLVLRVCLGEVERSRPFLLVLLGDRYGWAPPEGSVRAALGPDSAVRADADLSVTALEVEVGVLQADDPERRCRVFLREPLPYDAMRPEVAARYSEDHRHQAGASERLRELKCRLLADPTLWGRVHRYAATWDAGRERVAGLETWGEQVLELLWQDLDEATRSIGTATEPASPPTWQAEERATLDGFVADRLRDFVGRQAIIRELLATATGPDETGPWGVCVTGVSGAGKSALFARLHRELTGRDDLVLLAHAAGISARSTGVEAMLRLWIDALRAALGEAAPDATMDPAPERTFAELLARCARQRRVVLLVDALDRFERAPGMRGLSWLPTILPANVRFLATTLGGSESEDLKKREGIRVRELPGLRPDEARSLAAAVCRRHHRELNPALVEILLAKTDPDGTPAATVPLWLELAVEELNRLGADDFERAESDPRYANLPDPGQRLFALLRDAAEMLPLDIRALYDGLLARAERLYGVAWVRSMVSLIALGREGWRDSDLRDLLPQAAAVVAPEASPVTWTDLHFAAVRRSLRAHLVQRGGAARWSVFHAQLRDAILARCLPDVSKRIELHERIAAHLAALPSGDPVRATELVYHLLESGQTRRAGVCYLDSSVIGLNFDAGTQAFAGRVVEASDPDDDLAGVRAIVQPVEQPNDDDYFLVVHLCKVLHQNVLPALKTRVSLWHLVRLCEATELGMTWALSKGVSRHFDGHLAASHQTRGDLLVTLGDFPAALSAYADAIRVFTRLYEFSGKETDFAAIAGCQERAARVFLRSGDGASAARSASVALNMFRELSTRQPEDPIWAHDVARCHGLVSEVHVSAGDWTSARFACEAALQVRRQYLDHIPRTGREIHLKVEAVRSGFCPVPTGESEGLFDRPPTRGEKEQGLARDSSRLAEILAERGSLARAIVAHQAARDTLRRLLVEDPANVELESDLAAVTAALARALLRRGDWPDALAAARTVTHLWQGLADRQPDHALWRFELSRAHELVGDVLAAQGDLVEAVSAYQRSLAIRRQLLDVHPDSPDWQRAWTATQHRLAALIQPASPRPEPKPAPRRVEPLPSPEPVRSRRPDNVQCSGCGRTFADRRPGELCPHCSDKLVPYQPRSWFWVVALVVAVALGGAGYWLATRPGSPPARPSSDFFPNVRGTHWSYEIAVPGADAPLMYEEVTWPLAGGGRTYVTRGLLPGHLEAGGGAGNYRLELRVKGHAPKQGPLRYPHGVEIEVVRDDLGVFRHHKQVFWAISDTDRFQVNQVVTYPPETPGAPHRGLSGDDGSAMRLHFFDGTPETRINLRGSGESLRFIGVQKNLSGHEGIECCHFVRTVQPGERSDSRLNRGFTEDLWFARGKGLVRLVQRVDGVAAMTWSLVSFSRGDGP